MNLTAQQRQMLTLHKQQTFLQQSELERKINAAEQEMWQITGGDQPQIGNIEQKAREIERLRGDQRVAFVRAVGDAANVLTADQRSQLTGAASAQPMQAPAPMAPAQQMSEPAPMAMPAEKPGDM